MVTRKHKWVVHQGCLQHLSFERKRRSGPEEVEHDFGYLSSDGSCYKTVSCLLKKSTPVKKYMKLFNKHSVNTEYVPGTVLGT